MEGIRTTSAVKNPTQSPPSPESSDEERQSVGSRQSSFGSNNSNASLNILIIEDFAQSSSFMSSSLKFCRAASCTIAPSATEALEILDTQDIKFDIILCDVMLGTMSGIEVIRKIREIEIKKGWNAHIIIAMSADEEFSDACVEAGASLFLHKHAKPMSHVFRIVDEIQENRRKSA